ncbi:threonylcarbamoyladenosine tRNA methylthiotransferase MtaB [Lachnospiraceae bacterium]|nr:threonylcarbamoyladenosine tRNA methylthiotransferase MtaB [Lachnospiraceae bacterium]
MDQKTVAMHNLGCKVNAYEMEHIAESLKNAGYEIVPFEGPADYYIVNTCSVTNIADRKSRQMLHRAKNENPDAVVIAAGCYVNTRGEDNVLADGIDIVVPNEQKKDMVDIIRSWEKSHNDETLDFDPASSLPSPAGTESGRDHAPAEGGYTRAFLKVQDGCNMFCSYCIIPYARGRIQSRTVSDVVQEVTSLVAKGYHEFVLTGIHLSSFGKDRPADKESLLDLIRAVDAVPGADRIRLGSLEPRIITDEFAEALAEIPSICPQFHLSLQSGSDGVLKRMNRHYTADEFFEGTERLRRVFKDPAITTDVIVGFPGETPAEFEETQDFLKKICFYETHIFPYSRRKGTPADKMPDQLSRAEKHDRVVALKELHDKNKTAFQDIWLDGRTVEILVEENNEGYTREYVRVRSTTPLTSGAIVRGRITGRINADTMEFTPETDEI